MLKFMIPLVVLCITTCCLVVDLLPRQDVGDLCFLTRFLKLGIHDVSQHHVVSSDKLLRYGYDIQDVWFSPLLCD